MIYAIVLGWPAEETIAIHALGAAAKRLDARTKIAAVSALGAGETLRWSRTDAALEIARPRRPRSAQAIVFKSSPRAPAGERRARAHCRSCRPHS